MNILYVITQADGGGAQNYTLTLAKHFSGQIAAGAEDSKLFEAAAAVDVPAYPLKHLKRAINPYYDFLAAWEIRELIKRLDPDIIHLNSSKVGILGSFAAIGLKKKVVFTAHGFVFNEPLSPAIKAFYLALEKTASAYRDYIITVSDADKNSALENNLIAPEKIITIHNGIEPLNFLEKNEARDKLGLSKNMLLIGAVANFYYNKGLDTLLEAFALLPEDLKKQTEIVLFGDGPEKINLINRSRALNISKKINFLGQLPNAAQYLRAFDIFALPSRKEGFPYALLEAMQAGIGIVATKVGGIPEALENTGLLIEKDSFFELKQALEKLLTNTKISRELAQLAMERAKKFSEEKMLAQTENIYRKLLN